MLYDCTRGGEEVADLRGGKVIDDIGEAEDEKDDDPLEVLLIVDKLDLAGKITLKGVILPEQVKGINLKHCFFIQVYFLELVALSDH